MSSVEATVIIVYLRHMAHLVQSSAPELVQKHMPRLGLPCPQKGNIITDAHQPFTIKLLWPKVPRGGVGLTAVLLSAHPEEMLQPLHRNLIDKTGQRALTGAIHALDQLQIETIYYQERELLSHGPHHAERPRQHPYALAQASRVPTQKPQQTQPQTMPQQPTVIIPVDPIPEQTIPGIDPKGMTGIAPSPKTPTIVSENDRATHINMALTEAIAQAGSTSQSLSNASDKSDALLLKGEVTNSGTLFSSGSGTAQPQAPSAANSLRVQFFRELSLKDQKLAEVQRAAAEKEKAFVQRLNEARKSEEVLSSKLSLSDEKLVEMQRRLSVATAQEKALIQRLAEVRTSEEASSSKLSLTERNLGELRRALAAAEAKEKAHAEKLAEVEKFKELKSRLSESNHRLEEQLSTAEHALTDERRKRLEVEEHLMNTEANFSSEQRRRMEAEARLDSVGNALVDERRRRLEVEGILADITREQKEPFVVPALLEAFVSISKMTTAIKKGQ
ncbi:hypothetical protein PC9H_001860 [Pleurotus ostreatus]|uniref:Uncharacterized protein n=1 Tax=Pleurotus ostreatus TaxID=5322 RepID=A0A8H7DNN9_PLEOS|nr:uncharacterized protein PC9H_001860 [Pleurotus ostreatus]KAF7419273.1 hypothetical protein PC9H_001860 [Pleurotus ostreatus]